MNTTVNFVKLNDLATIPTKGSVESAGYDIYAAIDHPVWIAPHETVKIGTGFSIELPKNTFGAIFARSGLATEFGLRPANCVGVIDSDFRGECTVAIYNDSQFLAAIEPHERIAQLIILPYISVDFCETNKLSDTARGTGGFGSTGFK